MLKSKQIFLKCCMIIQLKHFYDSLNIIVTLAPGREFFFAKCEQFLLTFTE